VDLKVLFGVLQFFKLILFPSISSITSPIVLKSPIDDCLDVFTPDCDIDSFLNCWNGV